MRGTGDTTGHDGTTRAVGAAGAVRRRLLPLPITIELETLSGFPSPYGPGCVIPHIDATFHGSYDPATGAFEMSVDQVPVGAAPECGAWTSEVNAALGTPTMGRSVIAGTILDDEGEPVSFE